MENKSKDVARAERSKEYDPIEKCVICGADTPYRMSTPVSRREFYVEGSGQICRHCHYEIYVRKGR